MSQEMSTEYYTNCMLFHLTAALYILSAQGDEDDEDDEFNLSHNCYTAMKL
jgi:hypothetical protein